MSWPTRSGSTRRPSATTSRSGCYPEPKRTASGYRDYTDADVDRLRFVRRAAGLDLQLDEVREILALRERGEPPCSYVVAVAEQRVADLDQRIAHMQHARDELRALLAQAGRPREAAGDCFCHLIEPDAQ